MDNNFVLDVILSFFLKLPGKYLCQPEKSPWIETFYSKILNVNQTIDNFDRFKDSPYWIRGFDRKISAEKDS